MRVGGRAEHDLARRTLKVRLGNAVRFIVRPAKAGVFSRRQPCRGRNQGPVAKMAACWETATLKPIDNVIVRMAANYQAVAQANEKWPRNDSDPEAELAING